MPLIQKVWFLATLVICSAFIGSATVQSDCNEPVRLKEPRLQPLTDSEMIDRQRELLAPFRDAVFQNILRTAVRHPTLFESWLPFATYAFGKSTLPPRDREILMLRICCLYR